MSVNRWMDKEVVVHIHNEMLLSHKMEHLESVLMRWMNWEPFLTRRIKRMCFSSPTYFYFADLLCPCVILLSTSKFTYVCVCVCVCARALVSLSCPSICNPMDCSPPRIFQARTLKWVAILFSIKFIYSHKYLLSIFQRWCM